MDWLLGSKGKARLARLRVLRFLRRRFRLVMSRTVTSARKDIAEVLPAAGDALRPNDALIVDEKGEGGHEDLVALRNRELLLGQDREAGFRLGSPLPRGLQI